MPKTRQFRVKDDSLWKVFEAMPGPDFAVPSAFSGGWLCFERGKEVWRLAPIPLDWENASESALADLLTRAKQAKNTPL